MSKCTPVEGLQSIENAEQDYRKARRYGQYKIGELALFYPDKTYIPIAEITELMSTQAQVPTKGCCGIVLTSPAVEFMVSGKKTRLIADSEKQAKRIIDALSDQSTLRKNRIVE